MKTVNEKDSKSTKSVISRLVSLFRNFLSESNSNSKFKDYSKADLNCKRRTASVKTGGNGPEDYKKKTDCTAKAKAK